MILKIIVCSNKESLGVASEKIDDIEDIALEIAIDNELDIEFESSFKYWNGGPGYRHPQCHLRLIGYGAVSDKTEDVVKAIGYMLNSDPAKNISWPSYDDVLAYTEAVSILRLKICNLIG